jgi:integrase
MASIQRRPDGRWRARYRDPAGKERAHHARTKAEAQAWLDRQTASIVRGDYIDPKAGKVTFADYVVEWIATKAAVSARTKINVEGRIENHAKPYFGPIQLASVRPVHARAFVADLQTKGLAPATIKATVLTTRQVFHQAMLDGIIARSPFIGVELPSDRNRQEQHYLDANSVNLLASALSDDRYRCAVYLAAYGGLRAGELWALRPDRLNVLSRTIDVVESASEVGGGVTFGPTKTGRVRSITVPRFLAEMIGEHMGRYSSAELVFTASRGGVVRHRNFMRRHFKPAVEATEALPDDLRWHDLRHTCAALLIANGRHLEEVKDYLGHSSIRVTSDRYGHLFPKAKAELADSLDATFQAATKDPADFSRTAGDLALLPSANQGP